MALDKLYCACSNRVCLFEIDFNPTTFLWRPMVNGRVVLFYKYKNACRCVPVFADRQLALNSLFDILHMCKSSRVSKSQGR